MPDTAQIQAEVVNALGALVVNVAAMEESLRDGIWLVSGGEDRSVHVLTAGLPFRVLVEKFGALCAELGNCRVSRDEVLKYCDSLNKLNDQRNTIIHSVWSWGGSEGLRRFKRTAKSKSGFSLNVTKVKPAEIRDLAENFREAEKKLWELVPD